MAITAMMLFSCSTGIDKEKTIVDSTKSANPTAASGNKISPPINDPVAYKNWDKKIIKTADVVLELKNYKAYDNAIHAGFVRYGAYISQEEQQLSEDRSSNSLTIKVPVEQFESLMNSFSGDSIKVLQKKISTEEVTGEIVDTQSRILAKKQVRDRYLDLLKQARNMKEILEVQQEINSVQEIIESADGRLNYLQRQSAYSTIHLQYFQYAGVAPVPQTRISTYFIELKNAFSTGVNIIAGISVFVVALWPLLLIGIAVFFLWKRNKVRTVQEMQK